MRHFKVMILHLEAAGSVFEHGVEEEFVKLLHVAFHVAAVGQIPDGREFGGDGEFHGPVARRGDERHLNIGQVIVVGGVVEPQAVACIVHRDLLALFQRDVAHGTHACLAVHQIGVFPENKERIAPEGRRILFRFRNVAEPARRNEGLAVLDGALPHEHGFGKVALLTVLVFEGLVPQAAKVGNEGHVARRGQAVRTFRGRRAGNEKAYKGGGDAGNEKFAHQNFLVV